MPLKMTLEPNEWLMIGGTRVVNIHPLKARFQMDGAAPVLRQALTMNEADADTPAKRTYLAVQRLYLKVCSNSDEYQNAASKLLESLPSSRETVLKANIQIDKGSLYGALREYRKLLDE